MSKEQNVQECDANAVDQSLTAGYKKIKFAKQFPVLINERLNFFCVETC
jgi:hypothetical protein